MSSDTKSQSSASQGGSFGNTGAQALTVDEARSAILDLVTPTTRSESVAVTNCVDRICAEDIFSRHPIPPFRNSAMDGYAIRFDDLTNTEEFRVIGKSLAGHPYKGPLDIGTAVEITTGASLPEEADTIVIKENTRVCDGMLTLTQPPREKQHVRYPGDDIAMNSMIINQYKRLNPSDCGLIAAQGINEVKVSCRPKVGVFSTGDELCERNNPLDEGQIYDSNRVTITSLLTRCDIDVQDLGIVRDNPAELQSLLTKHRDFDFILSSGGVSVGQADYVKEVVGQNGELVFWKVAMKPGKPMVTAKLTSGTLYFGLPGNPVSSLVTCVQFVIPALQAFSGEKYTAPTRIQAKCSSALTKEQGRFEFQRGWLSNDDGQLTVTTTGLQDSHVLSSVSQANCFICLPQQSSGASIGEFVEVLPFNALRGL
jgi:molybdopterin molybdotransferase